MQRYITVLFLAGALFAPAIGSAQDRADQRNDRNRENQRYYDSRHRDWHDWNDNENRAYRQYLQERHRRIASSTGPVDANRMHTSTGVTSTAIPLRSAKPQLRVSLAVPDPSNRPLPAPVE